MAIYRVQLSPEEVNQTGAFSRHATEPHVYYVEAQVYDEMGDVDLFEIVGRLGNDVSSQIFGTPLEDKVKSEVRVQHINRYYSQ